MIRSIFPKKRSVGLLAAAATFAFFSTTAMAQVEQRSEVSIQGTALVTKDIGGDSLSQHTTKSGGFLLGYYFGFKAEYRGLVYKDPDFKLTSLNPNKITHLAQPSVGIYFRF